MIVLINYNN